MKESRIMIVNRYLIRLCLYLWATNNCFSITFIRELTLLVCGYTGMGVSRRVSMFR